MWILLIKFQKYSLVYEVHLTESFKKLINDRSMKGCFLLAALLDDQIVQLHYANNSKSLTSNAVATIDIIKMRLSVS